MTTIRAVIFDFGRVICDFDIGLFFRRAATRSAKSLRELEAVMTSSMDVARRYETGLMTSDEFFGTISRLASLHMQKDEFVKAYADIFTPIPATFDLVKRLKAHYRLGLLSNTNEWHFEYGIRPVEIFPLFDTVSLSYVVRSMKPDRGIYDDAIAKLGLPPEACAYIDDLPANVEAGRALGLHAIRYTTHEELIADLHRLGVDP